MDTVLLTLHLTLLAGLPQPAGVVVLVNDGDTSVGVWRTGNAWGDPVLSFEVLHDGVVLPIVRREQEYTRNVPSSFSLAAASRHEWPFDLGDGSWDAQTPLDQLDPRHARLVGVYAVPPSPEAERHGVWTGQLRSAPVALR